MEEGREPYVPHESRGAAVAFLRYNCAVRITLAAALAVAIALPAAAQRSAPPQPPQASGVIFGRVTALGNPAVNALVTVVHEQDPQATGKPRLGPRNVRLIAVTNRSGEYRLTNVPQGRYYVVALPQLPRVPPANRRGYAVTYYPSAVDHSESREVTVRGGEPVEADIRLVPARVSLISGVAIGSNGRPLSNGIIQLGYGAPLFGVGGTTLPIGRDGFFTSPALAPGVYSLQTSDGQAARAMGGVTDPVMSGSRITVADDDVSGVRLEPIRQVAVRGRVVAPDGVAVRGLSVSALPLISEGPAGPQRPGSVGADGTFEFHTWPGRVIARVAAVEAIPGGTRLRQLSRIVRLNGADVTTTGIDIEPGRDVGGLVIEIGR